MEKNGKDLNIPYPNKEQNNGVETMECEKGKKKKKKGWLDTIFG